MKKKLIIGVICISLLLLTACAQTTSFPQDITSEQILNAATAVQSYANVTEYTSSKNKLDIYTMSMWADGIFGECSEYDLLSDYAICYSNDNGTYEISVLRAKSKDDVQNLVSLLERRKATISAGDKAAYDPDFKSLINDARILEEENFVILLITRDNNAVITAIENLKQ